MTSLMLFNYLLFAGDTNILSNDPLLLKANLKKIKQWCLSNKLILNYTKTFHMILKSPNKKITSPNDYILELGNRQLETIPCKKFLGINLDNLTRSKAEFVPKRANNSRGEQSLLTTGVKLWNAYLMGGADWASRSAWKVDGLPVGVWFIADWVASLVPDYLTMPLLDFFILVNWNFTYSHAETKTKKIQKNDKESY